MSKSDWFDWSTYNRGGISKPGKVNYGKAVQRSAKNVASGDKKNPNTNRKFPVSIQKVAAAIARKYNSQGKVRGGVPRNATADQMLAFKGRR